MPVTFPPPISRKRTLSPRRGRLACVLRRWALFPAVVEGFATVGGRRAVVHVECTIDELPTIPTILGLSPSLTITVVSIPSSSPF